MHGIEAFRLLPCHADALLGDDPQAGILEDRVDLAGQVRRVASGLMMERVRSVAMVVCFPDKAIYFKPFSSVVRISSFSDSGDFSQSTSNKTPSPGSIFSSPL